MRKLLISRRRLLGIGAASASSLILSGCDQFDFLGKRNDPVRDFIEGANNLTYNVQRGFLGDVVLAREYSETEIRQGQRPNGSVDPTRTNTEYAALRDGDFVDYRLKVIGLVETPLELSLNELRNMPSRTQITRHDCVEGWSCIAKWTGTPLKLVLDQAKPKANGRFLVFQCYDSMGGGLSAPEPYYESCDLIDAYHPQTILAYGLNNEALPLQNGAPMRVRIERTLGYKQPKYVHTIEVVDSLAGFGLGQGGYWEDHGYDWYGGI
jgi:DMSO/TMAO reductase YedYZ molybdopterin-dependent catalytic subunit